MIVYTWSHRHRWTWADEWLWRIIALECALKSPGAAARAAFRLLP